MQDTLTREEMKSVIEGRGCARRVPIMFQKWVGPNIYENPEHRDRLHKLLSEHPQDVQFIRWCNVPVWDGPDDDPNFCWMHGEEPEEEASKAHDAMAPLSDWAMLDDVLAHFPSADYSGLLPSIPKEDGRYRAGHWWYNYFERHWQLRGMSDALMDYYTNPDEVHRLFGALTDFYLGVMKRMKAEGADGIYVTDDLGTQNGPFFSPEIFDEFYAPYYKQQIDAAHEMGMHFWLHSCGDIDLHMPKLIDMGLDVIHPIQKFAMDADDAVAKYGGKICFWAGFDVQQTIPFGTVEEVRAETRKMFDTYFRSDGRFMFTLGNGATPDTPIASLEALFDEAYACAATKGIREE
jgi:uroporphyrinogen decarboxylase